VEPAGCGTVNPAGALSTTYTAPGGATGCTVRATSVADPARSGYAAVTVTSAATGGLCGAAAGQLFPPSSPWNTPVDAAPLDAQSADIIAFLAGHRTSYAFQIAFDFNILHTTSAATARSFQQTASFYSPDCDPAPMPLPPGGRLESETSYHCSSIADSDCHLTMIETDTCRLWEMWKADVPAPGAYDTPGFAGGCLAIWDLAHAPPVTGRGDSCTSADAAGLPILPLVFTPDEVASGTIDHAIRFILPNNQIYPYLYVRPGTHSAVNFNTGAPSSSAAPPYAARLRLKASKDLSGLSAGAQVIARALKKYGMILADGGNVTFTATTDDLTAHTWAEVGVNASSLKGLSWNDFEVVELGARIDWSQGDCRRTPITH
jgi:serine/threonine-protein kinase